MGQPIPLTCLRFTSANAPSYCPRWTWHQSVRKLDRGQCWQVASLSAILHTSPPNFVIGLSGISSKVGIHSGKGRWYDPVKRSNKLGGTVEESLFSKLAVASGQFPRTQVEAPVPRERLAVSHWWTNHCDFQAGWQGTSGHLVQLPNWGLKIPKHDLVLEGVGY